MADRTWDRALPLKYAESKQSSLDKRWKAELGDSLRAMVSQVWPSVPEAVFLGFTAFSTSAKENTTEAVESQKFHEIGYFQTEAGLREKPAPDRDPDGEYNNWGRLHDDPLVIQLLGRKATMSPDGWKDAIPDQVAVGLVNLRKKLDSLVKKLPDDLKPKDYSSTWAVLLAFTAFSRGGGQTLKCLRPYMEKLGKIPENDRWAAWESMIAADITKDIESIGNKDGKAGGPWAIMRTRQKHDSGLLFAERTGLPADWFVKPVRERDVIIVKKAYDV